ncbi:MAG: hypothetical protein Q7S39_03095 [Ignavibacteria bacterium]|nr:hypothetical protein [Ignavibacteria bacterium]
MTKLIISFTLVLFACLPLYSQSGSAYTRLGIGDLEYTNSARRTGMGQLGTSVADENFINSLNPASWYKINRTRIEFAVYYNGMFISDNNNSGYFGEMEFSGFSMAFPISELYGITASAGLVPFSNVSYEIKESFQTPEPYDVSYNGSGGLSKMFAGTSYKLPFGLVLGANFDYYFGNLVYKSRIDFINSTTSFAEYENRFNPKGVGGTFGFISPDFSSLIDTNSISEFRFGASVSYLGSLDLDTLLISRSSTGIDTINSGRGEMEVPLRFTVGANVIFNKNYLISLDYAFQPWSEFRINNVEQPGLRNAQKFSLGFEYHPLNEPGITFWEQIIWRSGLSFEETQYMINNEGINQYSVSGGFSLPISFGNTLDLGVQYSMRGTNNSNLIKENIIRLNVGISFGELWFIRQSY